jgi:hypothetical protein
VIFVYFNQWLHTAETLSIRKPMSSVSARGGLAIPIRNSMPDREAFLYIPVNQRDRTCNVPSR